MTNYCKNLLLEDGSVVANPNSIEGLELEVVLILVQFNQEGVKTTTTKIMTITAAILTMIVNHRMISVTMTKLGKAN